MNIKHLVLLIFGFISALSVLSGQKNIRLTGTVSNEQKQPLPGRWC
ncbi:MAG: hypothetical protein R3B47_17220 [Bacteroidia bacterium]